MKEEIKEKTYQEKLLDKTFNELQEDKKQALSGQNKSGSDFFWWSWEAQINAIDDATEKLMKLQIETMLKNYGYTRVVRYIEQLKELALKEAELEKLKKKL